MIAAYVVDRDGNILREFDELTDAVIFNRITHDAAFAINAATGNPLTQPKPKLRVAANDIESLVQRAARSRGGVTLADEAEELPDIQGAAA